MNKYTDNQRKAIENEGHNIAVVAGAGSGKTSVLVARYINLVEKGIDPKNILAITFTKKAAGEMSERIRREIIARASKAKGDDRIFWEKCKKSLPLSQIETIHGFCSSVVRSHPVEAGVDPAFAIADEMQISLLADEAVKHVITDALQKGGQGIKDLFREYGYASVFRYLKKFTYKFSIDFVRQPDFLSRLSKGHEQVLANAAKDKEAFLQCLSDLLQVSGDGKSAGLAAIIENLHVIEKAVAGLPENAGNATVLEKYINTSALSARGKNKDLIKEVRYLKDRVVAACRDYRAVQLMAPWAEMIKAVIERFSQLKTQKKLVSFDDLEYKTYNLLTNNEKIRGKYSSKYTHIMIDEFQDTNMLQKAIAYILAGGDENRLSGNKLFVVGDDKQSIYRFRGAQVSVFGKVREDIEKSGGEQIPLMENFRSQKDILDVCNDVFSMLMEGAGAKYQPLLPGKVQEDVRDPVELLLSEDDGRGACSEAESIAGKILLMNEEGHSFSDMAVLLRAKTYLAAYTSALEKYGIPYNILDGQGYFETPEISDMINLLRFLDNSLKDIPLIGVLRSPLFAIDDAAITALMVGRSGASLWERMNSDLPEELDDKQLEEVLRAKGVLEELLQKASVLSLGMLTRYAIEKLRIMPFFMLYPDGRQKYANMEKFVDIVFAFEFETSGNLGSFLTHLDNVLSEELRESMEQIENEKSDSVKILTIHKSKGLQFPVVIVANCSAAFMSSRDSVFYDEQSGLAIKAAVPGLGMGDSLHLAEQRANENTQNRLEMQRLLYVAMTRAEKKLVLSAVKKETGSENWLNWIMSAFKDDGEYLRGEAGRMKKVTVDVDAVSGIKCDCKNEINFDVKTLIEQVQPLPCFKDSYSSRFSATAINDFGNCQRMYYYRYVAGMPEYIDVSESVHGSILPANITGLIAHSIIADTGKKIFKDAFSQACSKYAPGVSEKLVGKELSPWLEDYIASDMYGEITKGKYYNERSFCLPLLQVGEKAMMFAGSIDHLQVFPDGSMRIVDFKTDKSIDGKKEKYGMQVLIYALAAEILYPGKKVLSGEVHFLRSNEKIEISLAEQRENGLDSLREICSHILEKQDEGEYKTDTSQCAFCNYSYFCPKQ